MLARVGRLALAAQALATRRPQSQANLRCARLPCLPVISSSALIQMRDYATAAKKSGKKKKIIKATSRKSKLKKKTSAAASAVAAKGASDIANEGNNIEIDDIDGQTTEIALEGDSGEVPEELTKDELAQDEFERILYESCTPVLPMGALMRAIKPHKRRSRGIRDGAFRDKVRVHVKAGDGGRGCASFLRDKYVQRGPPDGGDGGSGGDIIFRATKQTPSLHHVIHEYEGQNGQPGGSKRRNGKRGSPCVIEVPPGTIVYPYRPDYLAKNEILKAELDEPRKKPQQEPEVVDSFEHDALLDSKDRKKKRRNAKRRAREEEKEEEIRKTMSQVTSEDIKHQTVQSLIHSYKQESVAAGSTVAAPTSAGAGAIAGMSAGEVILTGQSVDLDVEGSYFVAARGGTGGLGNWRLAAARNKPQAVATPGKPGEEAWFVLELKMIADIGLIGFPNAGKSTFLTAVSRAAPKVANYPFTTLTPHIGTITFPDYSQITIADLPGLIEGASENKGLGHEFLRHVERTSGLAYVVDLTGTRVGRNPRTIDPYEAILILRDEIEKYRKGMSVKPAVIIANKIDEADTDKALEKFKRQLKACPDKQLASLPVFAVSAKDKQGLDSVIAYLNALVKGSDEDCEKILFQREMDQTIKEAEKAAKSKKAQFVSTAPHSASKEFAKSLRGDIFEQDDTYTEEHVPRVPQSAFERLLADAKERDERKKPRSKK